MNTNLKYHVLQIMTEGGAEWVGRVSGRRSKNKAKQDQVHGTKSQSRLKDMATCWAKLLLFSPVF